MVEGSLVLEITLYFLQVQLEFLFSLFKVLLFLLDIGLFAMNYFLESAHWMEEFMAQSNHLLAVLAPKVHKNMDVWLILKLLH